MRKFVLFLLVFFAMSFVLALPVDKLLKNDVEDISEKMEDKHGEDLYKQFISIKSKNMTIKEIEEEREKIKEQARELIKEKIKTMIKYRNNSGIIGSDITKIVKLHIKPNQIEIDNETVNGTLKEIKISVNNRTISVVPGKSVVVIKDGGLVVNVTKISFENGTLMYKEHKVKILPHKIKEILGNNSDIKELNLTDDGNRAVYKVKHRVTKKFLGVFPVNVTVDNEIDAKNAKIVKTNKPWWSVLAI